MKETNYRIVDGGKKGIREIEEKEEKAKIKKELKKERVEEKERREKIITKQNAGIKKRKGLNITGSPSLCPSNCRYSRKTSP